MFIENTTKSEDSNINNTYKKFQSLVIMLIFWRKGHLLTDGLSMTIAVSLVFINRRFVHDHSGFPGFEGDACLW